MERLKIRIYPIERLFLAFRSSSVDLRSLPTATKHGVQLMLTRRQAEMRVQKMRGPRIRDDLLLITYKFKLLDIVGTRKNIFGAMNYV